MKHSAFLYNQATSLQITQQGRLSAEGNVLGRDEMALYPSMDHGRFGVNGRPGDQTCFAYFNTVRSGNVAVHGAIDSNIALY